MRAFTAFNLGLRFLLELAALAALGAWGAQAAGSTELHVFLAVAAPFAAATAWGAFVAPKRLVDVPAGVRLGVELGVFAAAVAGLAAANKPFLAAVLGVVAATSSALVRLAPAG